MSARIDIRFNSVLDVMSAKLKSAHVVRARPSRADTHVIFKVDASDCVVGLELLGPTDMTRSTWYRHPDRDRFPPDLLSEVDAWLEEMWSHLTARAQ